MTMIYSLNSNGKLMRPNNFINHLSWVITKYTLTNVRSIMVPVKNLFVYRGFLNGLLLLNETQVTMKKNIVMSKRTVYSYDFKFLFKALMFTGKN